MNMVEEYLENRIKQILEEFNAKHWTEFFVEDGSIYEILDTFEPVGKMTNRLCSIKNIKK